MNNFIKLSLLLLLSLQACTDLSVNCNDVSCDTPPSPFYFELINEGTDTNLLNNDTIFAQSIQIIDLADSSEVEFYIFRYTSDSYLEVPISFDDRSYDYEIKSDSTTLFTFQVDTKRVNIKCCEVTEYTNFAIGNASWEFNNNGSYRIFVDQD
ncbi:hypothetical protein [Sediminitomix flava]|uniref:Lipoprotein n=1 Tax=Sediminitomix flava TaxID=379075 RepID=A0A315ZGZ0_SEDFL|nr:hypothetical protein [Sediminitomix flava]PWJ44118.1 hypothetical protein BC781_101468 [Sediminitomix flava]